MADQQQLTPEVSWAQRSSKSDAERNYVYLTISVPDVRAEDLKLDLKPTSLTFTGYSNTKKATYHVELQFYDEIDPENSQTKHSARDVEMVLRKKELKEEYWPRLLKDSKKVHFLHTDFDKWVDEDEQEDKPDDEYLNQFGGGMNDMGGSGIGGLDFSKLGGAGGMGGMPGMGDMLGDMDDVDGGASSDDDDMPDLEGEDHSVSKTETGKEAEGIETASGETGASATKTSPLIQEMNDEKTETAKES